MTRLQIKEAIEHNQRNRDSKPLTGTQMSDEIEEIATTISLAEDQELPYLLKQFREGHYSAHEFKRGCYYSGFQDRR